MYTVLFRRASFFYWVEDKLLGEVANHKFVRSESDIHYTRHVKARQEATRRV